MDFQAEPLLEGNEIEMSPGSRPGTWPAPATRRGFLLAESQMLMKVGLTSDVGGRGGEASAGSCRGDQVAVSTLTFPWASLTHDHLTGEEGTDDAPRGWG